MRTRIDTVFPNEPIPIRVGGSCVYVFRNNEWHAWDGALPVDFSADIEITGTPVLNRAFTPSASGVNNIVTVSAPQYLKVYKVFLSPSADMTGEVFARVGTKKIGSVQSPRIGGQYCLMSSFPDFERGDAGEALTLTLPSATVVSLYVAYEVES